MTKVKAIFFWLSGVLTSSMSAVLLKTVLDIGRPNDNLYESIGFEELNDQLTLGLINDLEYCQTICNLAHLKIKPENLKEKILTAITPNISIYKTINLLPKKFQRWLIVDYPTTWFNQISERIEVHLFFPPDRRIILSKCGLPKISPDLFIYLPNFINLPIDRCLLVDNDPKRVIQAINYGLPSIIFVDAQRLEREFFLRKFISKL